MKKILCLIGKSGVGKTYLSQQIDEYTIPSYTTRKPRQYKEEGHIFYPAAYKVMEFWWENPEERPKEVIAHQKLYGEHYWITDALVKDEINVYIVDPKGYEQLTDNVDYPVFSVKLTVDPYTRVNRLMKSRDFEEVCERVINDGKMFSNFQGNFVIDMNNSPTEKLRHIINNLKGG